MKKGGEMMEDLRRCLEKALASELEIADRTGSTEHLKDLADMLQATLR